MKKIIILALFAMAICCLSCSSNEDVKKFLETEKKCEIKSLDLKSLNVDSGYYKYTKQYNDVYAEYKNSLDSAEHYTDLCGDESMYASWEFDETEMNKHLAKKKEYLSKADKFLKTTKALSTKLENLKNSVKSGELFVAKYKSKNKFGVWNDDYQYTILTKDDKGTIYNCSGNLDLGETIDAISSAYPEYKQEVASKLKEVFK